MTSRPSEMPERRTASSRNVAERQTPRSMRLGWLTAAALFGFVTACNSLLGDVQVRTEPLKPALGAPAVSSDPPAESCLPGSVRCEGAALELCTVDGLRWITTSICASPALCAVDPPECQPPACALDELRCEGAVLQVCNAARDGWLQLDTCATPAQCSPTSRQCVAEPCRVGDLACNGQALSRCEGVGWVPIDGCESRALCEVARLGGVSQCPAPACEATARRCEGADLLGCNEGQTAFELLASCASPSLCDAEAGACRDIVCEPGERRCNGAQIETCDEAGAGFVTQPDSLCRSAELCARGIVEDGLCSEPLCEEGQLRCTEGGFLQSCASGLDAFEDVEPCASPALCVELDGDARCAAPACRAGEAVCQSFRVLAACNSDLTGFNTLRCGLLGCVEDGESARCRGGID